MKKVKLFLKLMTLFMLSNLCLLGCENNNPKNTLGLSHHILKNKYVDISIVSNTLTDESVELTIKNKGDSTIDFLPCYEIHQKYNNDWYILKPIEDIVTPFLGAAIEPGENKPFNVKWKKYYGKLSSGEYRIVIQFGGERNTDFYAGVEFYIK